MSQLSPWQVLFLAVLSLLGLGALASSIQPTAPAAAIKPASIHSEKLISEPAGAVGALPVAAPTATSRPARAFRVGLQIGHYKNHELPDALDDLRGSTGTAGGGRREVDLNYDVANRVAKLLQAQGVIVDLLPATVPGGYNADAFIAIHADGSGSSGPRGYKISTRWSSTVAVQDGMLVDAITDAYRVATGLPEDSNVTRNMRGYYAYANRRPNWRTSYYTPGAIVEMGFMTNAADRAVMFNRTDDVAKGITNGIMDFLKKAYGAPPLVGAYAYGHGIVDDKLIPDNAPTPTRIPGSGQGGGGRPGGSSTPQAGNWQVVFMGKAQTGLYTERGSGAVVGTASRGQVLKATIRHGDYYFVTLPNGKQGWVHRNAIVVQI